MEQGTLALDLGGDTTPDGCAHPHVEASTAYSYGCRCARCADAVRAYKARLKAGRDCTTPSCQQPITTKYSRWCDACRVGRGTCQYVGCELPKTKGSGVRYCEHHRDKVNRPADTTVRYVCSLCDSPVFGNPKARKPRYEVCSACIESVKGLAKRAQRHGVPHDLFVMWARNPQCELCSTPLLAGANSTRFAIDHDHSHCPGETGCELCIRGLLCVHCNLGLGTYERMLDAHGALAITDYLSRTRLRTSPPPPEF